MSQLGSDNRIIDRATVTHLREEIEDRLAQIPRDQTFHKKEALELACRHGALGLTPDKLQHMVDLGLIRPKCDQRGDRDLFSYGRSDIRDIVLVQTLRHTKCGGNGKPLSYAKIANLFRDLEQPSITEGPIDERQRNEIFMPAQIERGLVYLRSRVLGMCLTWLFHGRIPVGAVVVSRQRKFEYQQAPPSTATYGYNFRSFVEVDSYFGNLRSDDLKFHVSEERELLHLKELDLRRFHSYLWHCWVVNCGSPRRQFDLLVGVYPSSEVNECIDSPVDDTHSALLFGALLRVCFLQVDSDDLEEVHGTGKSDLNNVTNPLVAITYVLPELSALWQYCAVLVPDPCPPSRLRLAVASKHFPLWGRRALSVEPGELLSGWAYEHGFPVIVQRALGASDPRLSHQDEEDATAAIAIPTRAAGMKNGVLYVGTRATVPEDVQVFSDAEIRLLKMVADIVGEILERNRIRIHGEQSALRIIRDPRRSTRSWSEFKDAVTQSVSYVLDNKRLLNPNDNLHITALRVEGYKALLKNNTEVAQWAADHVREITHQFYVTTFSTAPTFFDRDERDPTQFVCIAPRVTLTDRQDREYRLALRQVLSSLRLPFEVQHPTDVECFVWSMPFRLAGLRRDVDQREVGDVVRRIVRETEDALVALPFIEKGHEYESRGSYQEALDQYKQAHFLVSQSLYIMRHIAKTLAHMGDYVNAVDWWERIISEHPHPSHYRRLAYVLACLQRLPAAEACYAAAFHLDSTDATCLLEWANLLVLRREPDKAIELYRQAQRLDSRNEDLYLERIAEAHLVQEDFRSAWNLVQLLLTRNPENREAKQMQIQVLQRFNPGVSLEGLDAEVTERVRKSCQAVINQNR